MVLFWGVLGARSGSEGKSPERDNRVEVLNLEDSLFALAYTPSYLFQLNSNCDEKDIIVTDSRWRTRLRLRSLILGSS